MGPSFAVSPVPFAWLLGGLVTSVLMLVAMRPSPDHAVRMKPQRFEQFDHFRPVKKCVGGRWVYARQPHDSVR